MTETTSKEQSSKSRFIKAFLLIAFVVVAINLLSSSYSKYIENNKVSNENVTDAIAVEAETVAEVAKTPTLDYPNLTEAISALKPQMTDFVETEVSEGAVLLSYWGTEHMKWPEIQAIEKSKFKLVMKDPDIERGKQLCMNGEVIEIQVDNTLPNGKKIYHGGLFDGNYNIYRFIALGSTGELVGGSRAKFCGIITGKNDYSNSQGGSAHAVHLVGMFDLLDNKN